MSEGHANGESRCHPSPLSAARPQALGLARRGYVLENGRVVLQGSGSELLGNEHVKRAYLGM
jgi:ABC-type branched-subunit amino acid transport system ATPase component